MALSCKALTLSKNLALKNIQKIRQYLKFENKNYKKCFFPFDLNNSLNEQVHLLGLRLTYRYCEYQDLKLSYYQYDFLIF